MLFVGPKLKEADDFLRLCPCCQSMVSTRWIKTYSGYYYFFAGKPWILPHELPTYFGVHQGARILTPRAAWDAKVVHCLRQLLAIVTSFNATLRKTTTEIVHFFRKQ